MQKGRELFYEAFLLQGEFAKDYYRRDEVSAYLQTPYVYTDGKFADMQGMAKEDLNIQAIDGKLEISGMHKLASEGKQIWQEFENIEYVTAFKLSKEIDGTGATGELKEWSVTTSSCTG